MKLPEITQLDEERFARRAFSACVQSTGAHTKHALHPSRRCKPLWATSSGTLQNYPPGWDR